MFTDFFYLIRKKKVPVTITEWMTLMEALSRGYIKNLDEFYFLARAILIKSEAYYDHYDVAFQEYFTGIETPAEVTERIMDWLKDPLNKLALSEEDRATFERMDFDKLLKELEERIKEQTEQHDGGGHWIGRGGTSPFGHSGYHPAGIRIGGQSGGRHAVQIAQERRFRNYRNDLTLDIRQIKIALTGLRQLSRIGPEDELDLDESIKTTAKNAGEIDLIGFHGDLDLVGRLLHGCDECLDVSFGQILFRLTIAAARRGRDQRHHVLDLPHRQPVLDQRPLEPVEAKLGLGSLVVRQIQPRQVLSLGRFDDHQVEEGPLHQLLGDLGELRGRHLAVLEVVRHPVDVRLDAGLLIVGQARIVDHLEHRAPHGPDGQALPLQRHDCHDPAADQDQDHEDDDQDLQGRHAARSRHRLRLRSRIHDYLLGLWVV